MVHRLLTWLWWLTAGLIAGPGVAVTGDPGIDSMGAADGWHPSARLQRGAVIAVTLAVGAPPAGVAILAVIGFIVVLVAH